MLALADDRLDQARGNQYLGYDAIAISAAYFAAFYAASSVVAYHREEAKTHKGISKRFNYWAVHQSDFPAEVAALLNRLQKMRRTADYDYVEMRNLGETEAREVIEGARAFVDEVRAWFDRNAPVLGKDD